MLPLGTLLLLSLIAGLLGLDSTGALQVMVSRPLVAGGIVGWVLGDVATGLTVGSVVELLGLSGVPVGSLVPPDGCAAAIMASATAIRLAHWGGRSFEPAQTAALGVLASAPVGALGAWAEVHQRRLANGLSRRADADLDAGRLPAMGGFLAAALGLAWLRGALVGALCLGLGLPLAGEVLGLLPASGLRALDWCFWLYWLLGMAAAVNQFWDRRGLKYAAAAALVLAIYGAEFGAGRVRVLEAAIAAAVAAGLWRWAGARRGEWA